MVGEIPSPRTNIPSPMTIWFARRVMEKYARSSVRTLPESAATMQPMIALPE